MQIIKKFLEPKVEVFYNLNIKQLKYFNSFKRCIGLLVMPW